MGLRFPSSWRIAPPLALLLLAFSAVDAAATPRFVVPGGNSLSCTIQLPCSIAQAASIATAGDEIVLQPGNYSDAANDLGGGRVVTVNEGVSLHGVLGAPRPVITLTTTLPPGESAFFVNKGGSISHLEVLTTSAPREINVFGGLAEDMIVRSSAPDGVACTVFDGVLRNSACLSSGARGLALGSTTGGLGPRATSSIQMRSVTAVATGQDSVGMDFRFSGDFNGIANGRNVRTINGVGLIVRGGARDVVARSLSPDPHPAGSGAVMNVTLSHSNYASVDTSVDAAAAGGSATVTPVGAGNNITAQPRLGADGIHQLPGSPTIDAGAVDGLSGGSTLDGQPRTIGPAPDIGADEFTGSTITKISCDLSTVGVGEATRCTATVANDFESKAPAGTLTFATNGPGSFAGNRTCAIARLESGELGCRVTYRPSEAGSGAHTLTASYAGDDAHTPSNGSTRIRVPRGGTAGLDTKLKAKPRRETAQRRARFTFVSDPPGARFQCKLDRGSFKPCRSPFRVKVKPGRHVFSVRAMDSDGRLDRTPAVFRWKVKRS